MVILSPLKSLYASVGRRVYEEVHRANQPQNPKYPPVVCSNKDTHVRASSIRGNSPVASSLLRWLSSRLIPSSLPKLPGPKPTAALALIALASLVSLALLGDVRSASAQALPTPTPTPSAGASQPPQGDIYNLSNQQNSGPTFTFPTGLSQDLQDLYRVAFADIHTFSQNRFGVSVDTSHLTKIIVTLKKPRRDPQDPSSNICGRYRPKVDEIVVAHQCTESPQSVNGGDLAHEYLHALQTPMLIDFLDSPEWFTEGSAEYFKFRWLAETNVASASSEKLTYADYRSKIIDGFESQDPATLRSDEGEAVQYKLGFLAIEYLTAQTSENENGVATFFTNASVLENILGFRTRFQNVFGISLDDFYACFAAHREVGFPQPGEPCGASSDPPTPAPAPAPAANGRIVFSSNRDGNSEIYAMNADGTGVSRLTNHSGSDYGPAWSPDRQRIAFTSNRSGDDEIYVMNADGTGVSRLTYGTGGSYQVVPPGMSQPAWSPDGQRIAVSWNRYGDNFYEIYVMNADGTNVSRLIGGYLDFNPAWSPDGQRIAFERIVLGDSTSDIYVVNEDGSNLTRLTTNNGYDGTPAWSPDGERIAFASWRNGRLDIYVMNADGSNQTGLTDGDDPAWSPDGQRIAFSSGRDIYVMNADGSNPTRLTSHSAADLDPHWTSAAGSGLGSVSPPGDGSIADRVAHLERQVAALQSEASAQQTRIDGLDRLLDTLKSLVDRLAARVAALESAIHQPPPVATTTTTTTITPAVMSSSPCVTPIELGSTVHGSWTDDCLSENSTYNGPFYAKFYTFTIDDSEGLKFQITSPNATPCFFLLAGAGTDGEILHFGPAHSGLQLQYPLQPGSYTLEVTTLAPNVIGDFDLWLDFLRR